MIKSKFLQIKAVIFDCDGVMFDTLKANTAYYNRILNHFNKPEMTPGQTVYAQMHTAENSIAYLFENNPQMLKQAHEYRKKMTYIPFIEYMEIEPYLKPMLKELKHGHKTAIATNRTDTMPHVLKKFSLEEYFDLVITALDVKNPKPHPDQLLKVTDHFKIRTDQAIYIGDSSLDEQAARAAGMPLVAYKNSELSANFHIQSLKELENILEI